MSRPRWAWSTTVILLAASCSGREGGGHETVVPQRDSGPETHDADGDGSTDGSLGGDDCNDADPTVHPGAVDSVGDGVDQNCDWTDGVDADHDGHASTESGGDDCDDAQSIVHPGAVDVGWVGWTFAGNGGWSAGCFNFAGVSLVTAPDGAVHLAFYCWAGDGTREPIRHAVVSTDEPLAPLELATIGQAALDFRRADSSAPLALAVDASGTARFAWTGWMAPNGSQEADSVIYGVEAADGAAAERVDYASFVTEISLALDAEGAPHLAYAEDASITYATPLGDEWFIQGVRTADGPARSVAIAVDGAGAVQLVYRTSDGGVGWSRLAEGWTHAPIDGVDRMSSRDRVEITTAPDGSVHAVWRTPTGFAHATLEDDVWQLADVEVDGGVQPSLAVGSDGAVFVAHLVAEEDAALLSVGLDGEWTTEVVSTPIDHEVTSSATAVALSVDGAPITAFWYGGMYGSIDVRWKRLPDGVDDDCSGVPDDGGEP